VKVHIWGELGFCGPERRSRFEVRIEGVLPLVEALELVGAPEATSRSTLPVAGRFGQHVCATEDGAVQLRQGIGP
jgi:hypothetical protein